ncbi:uncharacterized protein LOC107619978 [Arachis ipaensis]|uniref:uncharacterized protein LOC107619978 n=1 Tax=Arachis ipaensis TaxID=130454 RepID=UPI0007AF63E2|nr:uncharacterized protein LOC107619978 [Arachis ipaensis]XP_025684561.1 uncharacterized protein LOC112785314 [Arachis hypogaea]
MHGESRDMSNNNRRTQSMKNSSSEGLEEHGSKPYNGTCFCRLQVVALKSKTRRNPGRWFFRCPLWKTKNTGCHYFQWMDETNEESVEVEESSKNGTLVCNECGVLKGRFTSVETKTIHRDRKMMMEHMKRVELFLCIILCEIVLSLIVSVI